MGAIRTGVRIDAPPEAVWRIISDLDGEARYWRGTTAIRNVSAEGNTVTREITIAFRGKKCMQVVTVHPMERIEASFTEGIMRGTKTLSMRAAGGGGGGGGGGGESTILEAEWDIGISGMAGVLAGAISRHVKKGTEQALEAIKSEAERGEGGGARAGARGAGAADGR